MGYLHQGHLSLISESQKHTHLTVVSIYVNPSQFAGNEDLDTYPSDFQGDIEKLKAFGNGVDVVFNPYNLYDYGGRGDCCGQAVLIIVEPDVFAFLEEGLSAVVRHSKDAVKRLSNLLGSIE
ncbi:pantoate--beta-alanine ligase [Tanacetum coccineum]